MEWMKKKKKLGRNWDEQKEVEKIGEWSRNQEQPTGAVVKKNGVESKTTAA